MCNAISLVVETLREEFDKVREEIGLDEFGMNGGHAVDAVRTDDSKIGHADKFLARLVDNRHTALHLISPRESDMHAEK